MVLVSWRVFGKKKSEGRWGALLRVVRWFTLVGQVCVRRGGNWLGAERVVG